jgi:hypothetical protein
MSDSAFKTAAYPSFTTQQLEAFIADPKVSPITREVMEAEIVRRAKVAAGDWSVMTAGERLRHAQATGRTRAGNSIG